ncbi:peroxiredoxin-like family protein [Cognatishimia sp. SS12]|uniref:peroxiredoxin-like family protein n=1 Tax=Cognatishimia sp. SS12 TaxID=2979465 RepID=UPI00233122B5|nr:peroxiredoxin-like family protein [Cognatishimia sp. SS12]MDC0739586.1 peroxiredoxin-like family protein [Cognatishimia sp. SS12]
MTHKLVPGSTLPDISVPQFGGGALTLNRPTTGYDWRLIIVYRGKHCGVCTLYLQDMKALVDDLGALGVEVVAVSADTEEKAAIQLEKVKPNFTIGHDLSVAQMKELGLYISDPRSLQETDAPFSEPGLFVIDQNGVIQIVDLANNPFMRPDLTWLMKGIKFVRNPDNNYPIRGTKT